MQFCKNNPTLRLDVSRMAPMNCPLSFFSLAETADTKKVSRLVIMWRWDLSLLRSRTIWLQSCIQLLFVLDSPCCWCIRHILQLCKCLRDNSKSLFKPSSVELKNRRERKSEREFIEFRERESIFRRQIAVVYYFKWQSPLPGSISA